MPLFGPNIKKMKERRDVEGLVRLASTSEKFTTRIEAIKALRDLKRVEELRTLLSTGGPPVLNVGVEAVTALRDLGDAQGLLEALALPRGFHEVRMEAVKALRDLNEIRGLLEARRSDDSEVSKAALEAIKAIRDRDSIHALVEALIEDLKYGEHSDKLAALDTIRTIDLPSVVTSGRPKLVDEELIEPVKNVLFEILQQKTLSVPVAWSALVTLATIGDRRSEILRELISTSDTLMKAMVETAEAEEFSPASVGRAYHVHEETLKALSLFKGESLAADSIMTAYDESFLVCPEMRSLIAELSPYEREHFLEERSAEHKRKALYALAALGHPSTKDRLEYLVRRGKAPEVLIEFYGKATYDEIKPVEEGNN